MPSTASGRGRFGVLAEGARLAAADGTRCGPWAARRAGARGRRGDRGRSDLGMDLKRGGSQCVGSLEDAGLGRAGGPRRRRGQRRGDGQPRLDRGDDGGRDLGLRRLKGVQRPALAVRLRSPSRRCSSSTSAPTSRPAQHLVQFAFLGAAFSAAVLDVDDPTVGLLRSARRRARGAGDRRGARDPRRRPGSIRRQHRGRRPAGAKPPTSSSPTASPATSR